MVLEEKFFSDVATEITKAEAERENAHRRLSILTAMHEKAQKPTGVAGVLQALEDIMVDERDKDFLSSLKDSLRTKSDQQCLWHIQSTYDRNHEICNESSVSSIIDRTQHDIHGKIKTLTEAEKFLSERANSISQTEGIEESQPHNPDTPQRRLTPLKPFLEALNQA